MNYTIMVWLSLILTPPFALGEVFDHTPASAFSVSETDQSEKSFILGMIGTETIQYSTPISERAEFNSNNILRAQIQIRKRAERSFFASSLLASKSLNLNYQYLAISELYAEGPNDSQGFTLGRKISSWSHADEDWSMGLWQPLFQEDGLRQYQQGLMGLYYSNQINSLQVTLLASPFFIPTLNSDLVEKNGTLVSESRWMRSLPEQATVNGRDVKLAYRLRTPSYAELLMRPTFAAKVFWKDSENETRWASLSLARKPMNTLSIKYDAALVSRSVGFTGEAEVVPVVHMHDIITAEAGFAYGSTNFIVSMTADQPETKPIENRVSEEGFQTDYYQQQPEPIQVLTLKAESTKEILGQKILLTGKYLKAQTSKTFDLDSQGTPQSDFVPYRLQFTNAVSIQGKVHIGERWTALVRYLREFDQLGSIISTEVEFLARPQLKLYAGFDFLGVDRISQLETDNRFLNSYRHNDRFFGGLSYVF